MRILKIAFVLAAPALLWSVSSAAPRLDFDKGAVSVGDMLKEAREAAAEKPSVAKVQLAGGISRWTRDCEDITLQGDEMLSELVLLKATIYEQRCTNLGRHAGQICHEVPYRSESRQVKLKVEGRGPLGAGEKEVFSVCLDGWFLSASTRQSKLKYKFDIPDEPEILDYIITATVKPPKKK